MNTYELYQPHSGRKTHKLKEITMSDLQTLKAVENLLNRADKFDKLPGPQQAAFRAQLTKLIDRVDEPEIKAVLVALKEEVGEAETAAAKLLTADDLIAEYREKYQGYSIRQRGAFKAKAKRLLNKAKEDGDTETVEKLTKLEETIEETALSLSKKRILAMAKKRS